MTLQDRIVNPARRRRRPRAGTSVRARRAHGDGLARQRQDGLRDAEYVSEFAITLVQRDGTRRTFKRDGDTPKVVVTDPLQAHFDMLRTFRDKDMHDVTAFLWTLK
jgi:cytochrome c oxidase cbb3-type subunit 3